MDFNKLKETRITYNQKISEVINIVCKSNDIRYMQFIDNFNHDAGDVFYEEPWETYQRLKEYVCNHKLLRSNDIDW